MATQFHLVEPKHIDGSSFSNSHASTSPSAAILIWRVALFKDQPSTTSIHLPEDILVKALDTLFPQLSTSYPTGPTSEQIRRCVSSPSTYTLFLAIGSKNPFTSTTSVIPPPPEAILGALTLVTLSLLKTSRAHIEDLIVSPDARGMGLGRALMVRALDEAVHIHSCSIVDLTSKPDRIQARKLYESLGFTIRDTGAFRYYAPKK
ncbi:hypothetical protein BGW38_009515 [Lunasporangiospora selenospora]|uniref:N-acetyltransferase domain-containing protein n=1 Tax=Lunasporangiospora selenospora TaxID=979761 RepID=A0A9P6KF99_9FUNG|nr:hypothetical protein BGW38_009515 [Lunasporangiospora selenospora]